MAKLKLVERGGQWWAMGTVNGVRVRRPTGCGLEARGTAERRVLEIEAQVLREAEQAPQAPAVAARKGKTVNDIVRAYLKRPEPMSYSTVSFCEQFADAFGSYHVSDLVAEDLRQAVNTRKLVSSSQGRILRQWEAVLNYAADNGIEPLPPNWRLKKPPVGKARTRTTELDQFAKALDAADPPLRWLMAFIWYTGARRGEALTVRVGDVSTKRMRDETGRMVPVLGVSIQTARKGRSKAEIEPRWVEMHPSLIAEYERAQAAGLIHKDPEAHLLHNPTVQWNKHRSAASHAIANHLKRQGMEHFTLHDGRRTFATNLLEAGVDPYTVLNMLGDKSPNMLKHYAMVRDKLKRQSIAKLPDLPTS